MFWQWKKIDVFSMKKMEYIYAVYLFLYHITPHSGFFSQIATSWFFRIIFEKVAHTPPPPPGHINS